MILLRKILPLKTLPVRLARRSHYQYFLIELPSLIVIYWETRTRSTPPELANNIIKIVILRGPPILFLEVPPPILRIVKYTVKKTLTLPQLPHLKTRYLDTFLKTAN